ncbi:Bud site selection protein 20 [Thoreauomyces humboldtii]|nr:Bud site selection protein 20 [Thoreauomyces humboldtii]
MTRYRKVKTHRGIRDIKRAKRTRARVKDLDQVHLDLANPEQFDNLEKDVDLPGMGQHYCLQCARFFTDDVALVEHSKSKIHRRRLKELKDGPYTQKDAEAAAGLGQAPTSSTASMSVGQPQALPGPIEKVEAAGMEIAV